MCFFWHQWCQGKKIRFRLFLSTHWFISLSLVAFGHSWYRNESTCAEKKSNPGTASSRKDTLLFSDVNGVNGKTSSTTRVRLGQSMLDNIFFQFMSFFWCQQHQWQKSWNKNFMPFYDVNGVNCKKADKIIHVFFTAKKNHDFFMMSMASTAKLAPQPGLC